MFLQLSGRVPDLGVPPVQNKQPSHLFPSATAESYVSVPDQFWGVSGQLSGLPDSWEDQLGVLSNPKGKLKQGPQCQKCFLGEA